MAESAVVQFERAFAQWTGLKTAFAFWKGRVALHAILRGLGVGPGDEVLLPGYTCVMNVNPIKYLGARPVYVDIEPKTFNIDPDLVEAKITPRTRVLIAQHTYGYPCRMDRLQEIASRRGLALVEDCCLALGSTYQGRLCGTFGKAAYWSFQWNKPFTTGIGGIAATGDPALSERLRVVATERIAPPAKAVLMLAAERWVYRTVVYPRTTALVQAIFRWLTHRGVVLGSSQSAEFRPVMSADFFMSMSESQARAGLRQLGRLAANLEHRRAMARTYDRLLREAGLPAAECPPEMDPILVRYPVRVADKARAVAEAPRHFVELGTWFECPLHPIETPLALYDYTEGECPVAEEASRQVVNLPMHPRASQRTARRSVRFMAELGSPR